MNLTDGLKQAASTLRAADKIPEFNAILDAQQRIFDLQNDNQKLKEENTDLKKKLSVKNKLSFDKDNGVYHLKGDDRSFCPVCYENDARLSTLRWVDRKEWSSYYHCNVCGKSTYKGGYES